MHPTLNGKVNRLISKSDVFTEQQLTFASGYVEINGIANSNTDYAHAEIPVISGDVFKIHGYNYYNLRLYVLKNASGSVVSYFPSSNSGSLEIDDVITISENGTLFVNKSLSSPTLSNALKVYKKTGKSEYNSLYGKSIVGIGDSIYSGSAYSGGFAKIIADRNGMTSYNHAVGGATIASGTGAPLAICDGVSGMTSGCDFVLASGGLNDWGSNVSLGTITTNMIDTVDTSSFIGAMEKLCRNLLAKYVGKKIGFIFTHKITSSYRIANTAGLTMEDYHTASIQVLNKYSMPYCDLYRESCFNTDISAYLPYTKINTAGTAYDGTHPTYEGYNVFYVPKIESWMKTL